MKYFAGELTGEEEREMESWIHSDSQREEQVQKLYDIWRESEELPYKLDEEDAWNSFSRNMDDLERKVRNAGQKDFTSADKASVLYNKTNRTSENTAR